MGGSAIANPFGAYVAEPAFHEEKLVIAEVDLADRIVAKNVFDCMGHYSRWDVVSLRLREEDNSPTGPVGAQRRVRYEDLERVAARHQLTASKLESILSDLQTLEVSIDD